MQCVLLFLRLSTLWCFLRAGVSLGGAVGHDYCTETAETLACLGYVPEEVSSHVKAVNITDLGGPIHEHFETISVARWTHIESLTIRCLQYENEDINPIITIQNLTFKSFSKLKRLQISCYSLNGISRDIFNGLDNLTVLDLSDCRRLHVSSLTATLEGKKLPSLQQLILRRLSLFLTDNLVFTRAFFESLCDKPVRSLDLSGTKYGSMDIAAFVKCLPHLVEFNVSEGGFLAVNLVKALYHYQDQLKSLRRVDISYPIITDTFLHLSNKQYWQTKLPPDLDFVQNFTSISVQGCLPSGMKSKLIGIDFESKLCTIIEVVPNNIQLITFCISQEQNEIYLESLNIADNGLEDIDLLLTSRAVHMRYLDISHNLLNRMLSLRLEKALQGTKGLREIYMSHNSFSHIPYNMFINTHELEVIDTSNNQLETLTFKISHLYHLRLLRLDHNKIHTVYADDINAFDRLKKVQTLHHQNDSSSSLSFTVDIRSNPLECSCANKHFAEWVLDTGGVICTGICSLEGGRDTVYRQALSKINFQCNLTLIIVSSSVGGSLVIILGLIALILYIRRKKQIHEKSKLMKLVEIHREDGGATRFPVFLSFSSANEEFVLTNIVGEMNNRLQQLLNTSKNCVATGDTTFRPGFYLIEEMAKWIDRSDVIVLCVSKAFCKSPWCKEEVILSKYHQKPMVLMFLEEVEKKEMPKVLQTYFGNLARSKWVQDGIGVKLVPSWDTMCDSILKLMTTEVTAL